MKPHAENATALLLLAWLASPGAARAQLPAPDTLVTRSYSGQFLIQLDEDAANVRAQIAAEWERWGMLREISRWMPSVDAPMVQGPWSRHPQERDTGSEPQLGAEE